METDPMAYTSNYNLMLMHMEIYKNRKYLDRNGDTAQKYHAGNQ